MTLRDPQPAARPPTRLPGGSEQSASRPSGRARGGGGGRRCFFSPQQVRQRRYCCRRPATQPMPAAKADEAVPPVLPRVRRGRALPAIANEPGKARSRAGRGALDFSDPSLNEWRGAGGTVGKTSLALRVETGCGAALGTDKPSHALPAEGERLLQALHRVRSPRRTLALAAAAWLRPCGE